MLSKSTISAIVFLSLLTVSANAQKATVETRLIKLERKIDSLEVVVKSITSNKQNVSKSSSGLTPISEDKINNNNLLTLESWSYSIARGQFSDNYKITLNIKNGYDKDIKLLDASVKFSDLLDAHMYGIKISPDLFIPALAVKTETGEYEINEYINEQNRMKTMNKNDVKAVLTIRKIVFADNTIIEF